MAAEGPEDGCASGEEVQDWVGCCGQGGEDGVVEKPRSEGVGYQGGGGCEG